jgi:hypothetical protein
VIFSDALKSHGPLFLFVAFVLMALVMLAGLTCVFIWQTFFVIPRAKQQLIELNSRRAERVRDALSIGASMNFPSNESAPYYPFSGWLDLAPDGRVTIAGQSFGLHELFDVTSTDSNNVPRVRAVRAVSTGTGEILISSHGQRFVARFLDEWEVRSIPNVEQ